MPTAANRIEQAHVTEIGYERNDGTRIGTRVRAVRSVQHLPIYRSFVPSFGLGDPVLIAWDDSGLLNIIGTVAGLGGLQPEDEPAPPEITLSPRVVDDLLAAAAAYEDAQERISRYLAETKIKPQDLEPGAIKDWHIFPGTIAGSSLVAGTVEANKIVAHDITAAQLAALNITVGCHIQSDGYSPNEQGWHIDGDGTVEFGDGLFRGTIQTGVAPALRAIISSPPNYGEEVIDPDKLTGTLGIRWLADGLPGGPENSDHVTAFINATHGSTSGGSDDPAFVETNSLAINARGIYKVPLLAGATKNQSTVASVVLETNVRKEGGTETPESIVAIAADKVSWREGTVPMEFHVRRRFPPRRGICAVWFAADDAVQIDAYPAPETSVVLGTRAGSRFTTGTTVRPFFVRNTKMYLPDVTAGAFSLDLPDYDNPASVSWLGSNNRFYYTPYNNTQYLRTRAVIGSNQVWEVADYGSSSFSFLGTSPDSSVGVAVSDGTKIFTATSFGAYVAIRVFEDISESGAYIEISRWQQNNINNMFGGLALDIPNSRLYVIGQTDLNLGVATCYSTVAPYNRLMDCDFLFTFDTPSVLIGDPRISYSYNPSPIVGSYIDGSDMYILRATRDLSTEVASEPSSLPTRTAAFYRVNADSFIISKYDLSVHPAEAHKYRDSERMIRTPSQGDIYVSALGTTLEEAGEYFWILKEPEGTILDPSSS